MRKVVVAVAVLAVLGAGSGLLAVWLIARHDVARLRVHAERSKAPVPPMLRAAILAGESIVLERPRLTWRAVRGATQRSPRVMHCGPASLEYRLVRRAFGCSRREMISAYVVGRLFDPEELFRIYAHRLYLGRAGGQDVIGIESGSRAYFGKAAHELTAAEAATIAAMIRAPNYYSPARHPAQLLARRNYVLGRMNRFDAVTEPLRIRPAGR